MKHTTVSRLMAPAEHVVSVSADTPCQAVAELLDRHRVGAVPVLDGDGRVLGVVSETDLLPPPSESAGEPRGLGRRLRAGRAERKAEAKAAETPARELMTAPAVTIGPEATVP